MLKPTHGTYAGNVPKEEEFKKRAHFPFLMKHRLFKQTASKDLPA
jgi:hypothetical protein